MRSRSSFCEASLTRWVPMRGAVLSREWEGRRSGAPWAAILARPVGWHPAGSIRAQRRRKPGTGHRPGLSASPWLGRASPCHLTTAFRMVINGLAVFCPWADTGFCRVVAPEAWISSAARRQTGRPSYGVPVTHWGLGPFRGAGHVDREGAEPRRSRLLDPAMGAPLPPSPMSCPVSRVRLRRNFTINSAVTELSCRILEKTLPRATCGTP